MRHGVAILSIVGFCAACGGTSDSTPTPPPRVLADPGYVDLELQSPNADAGILFVVDGGAVDSVSGVGVQTFALQSANGVTILARGAIATGRIARLKIPDRNKISEYSVSIRQAASPQFALRDLQGYVTRLVKSP